MSIGIIVHIIGYVGMLINMLTVKLVKNPVRKQLLFGTGAFMLGVLAAYPDPSPHWIFLSTQFVASAAAFMQLSEKLRVPKIILIIVGAIVGSNIAILQNASIVTFIGIAGLVGIAIGFGSKEEKKGGHQNLALGIGGVLMVVFSGIEFFAFDIWKALPFLLLNVPFSYWSFKNFLRQK